MVQLTTEQRTFVVLHYSNTRSLTAVRSAFRERFPDRNPPSKTTILQNYRKYSKCGTSLNLNKSNSGRPRTARSPENIAAIKRLLEENPRSVSARRNPFHMSPASFNRITRLDLGRTSYSMATIGSKFLSSEELQLQDSEQYCPTREDTTIMAPANVATEDEVTTREDTYIMAPTNVINVASEEEATACTDTNITPALVATEDQTATSTMSMDEVDSQNIQQYAPETTSEVITLICSLDE